MRLLLAALFIAAAHPLRAGEPVLGFPERSGALQLQAHKAALWFPNGHKITVDVVDTPQDREKGLMFRRRLPRDYGMLFVFPQPMGLQFWMKNTLVSLDIVYIGEDKRITRIHNRVKPSTEDTPEEKVARVGGFGLYVLELPAGTAERQKLAPGQVLKFGVPIPEK